FYLSARLKMGGLPDLLANGVPIKQVAYQLGFSCPAAFTAAFRCILGATPRDYVP
ncbi:helix-turn-helix domain-containing protein, partial [Klebsiella pneumoniae]|uniref:helix-turn-helix domain-containing protein n=1 Tax=Klebsiella pneumoniae TaxID=573 RepID=UPI0011E5883A